MAYSRHGTLLRAGGFLNQPLKLWAKMKLFLRVFELGKKRMASDDFIEDMSPEEHELLLLVEGSIEPGETEDNGS